MPTYVFKGRNRMNEVVVGERVADNREALRQILRREQVTLTSVKEKGREIGIPKIGGRKKVKSKDLSIFTRQFSVMIDAGLPLVQCLDILAQQQDNKYFQQVLMQVRQDVEEVRHSRRPWRAIRMCLISCIQTWSKLVRPAVFSI
jgi:type IV pilus assembly protein PilC